MSAVKLIAFACGGLGCAAANALPPAPGPEMEVFLSGATAQDEALDNCGEPMLAGPSAVF